MIPIEKVRDIIIKHDNLEKELSSGNIDTKLCLILNLINDLIY